MGWDGTGWNWDWDWEGWIQRVVEIFFSIETEIFLGG